MRLHIYIVFMVIGFCYTAFIINVENITLNVRSFSFYSIRSRSLKNVLRLPNDVELLKTNAVRTAQGVEKSRLKELYRGKKVVGAGVEAQVDEFGNYVEGAITGTVVVNIEPDLPAESNCTLTHSQAVSIVLTAEGLPLYTPITEKSVVEAIYVDEKNVAHRAYEVDLYILIHERHPFYTIDKCSGEVLDSFNKMIRFTMPPSWLIDFSAWSPIGAKDQRQPTLHPNSSRFGVTQEPLNPTGQLTGVQFDVTTGAINPFPAVSTSALFTATTEKPNALPLTQVPTFPQFTAPSTLDQAFPVPTSTHFGVTTGNPSTPLLNTDGMPLGTTIAPNPSPVPLPKPTTKSPLLQTTQNMTQKPVTQAPVIATTSWQADATLSRVPRWTDPWLTTLLTSNPSTSWSWSPSWRVTATTVPTSTPSQNRCPTVAVGIGGNTKTQQYSYGVPPRCLNPTVSGDICLLENEFVKVVDLKGARYTENPPVANFTCLEGYPDSVNGAYSPALDAYFFATISGEVLKNWYGHTQDLKPTVQVHYGRNVDNAFYNPNTNVLTFGDGNWMTYPLVSLDVVSHELAHGITTQHSNLRYKGESGGIDESFSDMAGEVAEAYFGTNDWLVGADLVKSTGKAFRYFADPSKDGHSINHVDLYESNMDVHFSSGIYNTVFYKLVTSYNIDIRYAYEAFLTANLLYWKYNDGFTKAACGAVRGAYDTGIDVTNVISAFSEVGITACNIDNFIEKLDPAATRSDLSASSEVQPLFRFSVPEVNSGVLFTSWSLSGDQVGIALTSGLARSEPTLQTSYESLSYNLPTDASRQLYVRLFTDSPKVTTKISLSIQFI